MRGSAHRRFLVGISIVLLITFAVTAQQPQRATREDGVIVLLHADGHWELAPVPVDPTLGDVHVFFGNLHSHTGYRDGSGIPSDAYAHARDVAKLDVLAVTEHNHAQAGAIAGNHALYNGPQPASLISTAAQFNASGNFVALYGQEFSTISSGNHANVLEVGDVIDTSAVPNGAWDVLLNTWLPAHPDSEGKPAVMLLNHPATSDSPNAKEYGIGKFANATAWRNSLDPHAELINMINGPSHELNQPPGRPSESEFLRYLNVGLHVAPTADQDNHLRNWGSAAQTRTGIWAPSLTKANVLTALRERRVYASEDANLQIVGKVNGKLMGTRFTGAEVPASGSALDIQVSFNDPNEPNARYVVDVFADRVGGLVADVVAQHTQEGNGTLAISDVPYGGGEQYFFVKVTQIDQDSELRDRAWLAPVWFEPAPGGPGRLAAAPPAPLVSLALDVNPAREEAIVTNIGDATVNLKDWMIVSTVDNQRFKFPGNLTIAPREAVTVTSGSSARTGPRVLRWTTDFIWFNDGDPGLLLDPNGAVRAESP
jgi:hypothetical protein